MAVNVMIPEALRTLTGGTHEVKVEATSVREMFAALETKHPGFKERLFDEKGELRRFVNVFVNEEDIRFDNGLDTALQANATVSILPAAAGGDGKKKAAPDSQADIPVIAGPVKRRVYLTFTEDTTCRPMIYELVKKFDVIPNIRSASANEKIAIMSMEISGEEESLEKAFAWLKKQNVKVDPIEMNVVEP